MNMQTFDELTRLYVILNPCLSAKEERSPEVKETNPPSLSMETNLDSFLTWGENLLIKIGLVREGVIP